MQEITDSIKSSLIERTSSPFMGIFATTWITFNWRAILIVIWGEGSISDRITVIENSGLINPDANLFSPFIYSSVLMVVYPIITFAFFGIWQFAKRQRERIVEYFDRNTRISPEAYQGLVKTIKEQKSTLSDLVSEYSDAKTTAETKLTEAEKAQDALAQDVIDLQDKLQLELKTQAEQSKKHDLNVAALNEANSALQAQKEEAASDFNANQQELEAIKLKFSTREAELTQHISQSKERVENFNKLARKNDSLMSTKKTLEERNFELGIILQEQKDKEQVRIKNFDALKDALAKKELQLSQLREEQLGTPPLPDLFDGTYSTSLGRLGPKQAEQPPYATILGSTKENKPK